MTSKKFEDLTYYQLKQGSIRLFREKRLNECLEILCQENLIEFLSYPSGLIIRNGEASYRHFTFNSKLDINTVRKCLSGMPQVITDFHFKDGYIKYDIWGWFRHDVVNFIEKQLNVTVPNYEYIKPMEPCRLDFYDLHSREWRIPRCMKEFL